MHVITKDLRIVDIPMSSILRFNILEASGIFYKLEVEYANHNTEVIVVESGDFIGIEAQHDKRSIILTPVNKFAPTRIYYDQIESMTFSGLNQVDQYVEINGTLYYADKEALCSLVSKL